MNVNFIKYSGLWVSISAVAVGLSILSVALFGLRFSADFLEGSLYEVRFESPVPRERLIEVANAFDVGKTGLVDVRETLSDSFVLRLQRLSEEDAMSFLKSLQTGLGDYIVVQERQVSPEFAETFRDRAVKALLIAIIAIVFYIAFAFRKVSHGISSWKMGLSAIIALVHDVTITTGIYAFLGYLYGAEVDILFITALLAVLGYSVNDTIVVFDRTRENVLKHFSGSDFAVVVNLSLNQTMSRSINTSFTTVLVLVAMLLFGSSEVFWFVAVLAFGIGVGTYSSIFLASPLLVLWQKR